MLRQLVGISGIAPGTTVGFHHLSDILLLVRSLTSSSSLFLSLVIYAANLFCMSICVSRESAAFVIIATKQVNVLIMTSSHMQSDTFCIFWNRLWTPQKWFVYHTNKFPITIYLKNVWNKSINKRWFSPVSRISYFFIFTLCIVFHTLFSFFSFVLAFFLYTLFLTKSFFASVVFHIQEI